MIPISFLPKTLQPSFCPGFCLIALYFRISFWGEVGDPWEKDMKVVGES